MAPPRKTQLEPTEPETTPAVAYELVDDAHALRLTVRAAQRPADPETGDPGQNEIAVDAGTPYVTSDRHVQATLDAHPYVRRVEAGESA
jgi:hypothetical protein